MDLPEFGGPLHLLLDLARKRRIDLTALSMRELALAFVEYLKSEETIDQAAEQLVSASWVVALKARQLLQGLLDALEEPEPTHPASEAAQLAFRLQRLAAMQAAAARLGDSPQFGRDWWTRGLAGLTERPPAPAQTSTWQLMRAYGRCLSRHAAPPMRRPPPTVYALEEARSHLKDWIATIDAWTLLDDSLDELQRDGVRLPRETTRASTVAASLELARDGLVGLRQDTIYGPIYIRKADHGG